jgi:hypothetical protein
MDVGPALIADVQEATLIEPSSVRSTTQRYRPRRSEDSMPGRAIRTATFPSPCVSVEPRLIKAPQGEAT